MDNTQKIPNKDREPDTNKMKWEGGDRVKVASISVRGMRDPVKRGDYHTNGDKWG